MWSKKTAEFDWVQGKPGVQRAILRDHPEGGRTYLARFEAGSASGDHRHLACEEVLVLEGTVVIGGHLLNEGDFLFTEAGEIHNVEARTDALILVSTSKPIEFVAD